MRKEIVESWVEMKFTPALFVLFFFAIALSFFRLSPKLYETFVQAYLLEFQFQFQLPVMKLISEIIK